MQRYIRLSCHLRLLYTNLFDQTLRNRFSAKFTTTLFYKKIRRSFGSADNVITRMIQIIITMITAHIEKLFATRIAVFVKSLTEAMADGMHIILHGKRKKEMTSVEHRSINPLKGLFALAEIYMLRILKQKNLLTTFTFTHLKMACRGR